MYAIVPGLFAVSEDQIVIFHLQLVVDFQRATPSTLLLDQDPPPQ